MINENYWKFFEIDHPVGMSCRDGKRLRKLLPTILQHGFGVDYRFFEDPNLNTTLHRALKKLDDGIKSCCNDDGYLEINFTIGEAFLIGLLLKEAGDARNHHLKSIEEIFDCEFSIWKSFDRAAYMICKAGTERQRVYLINLLKESIKKLEAL